MATGGTDQDFRLECNEESNFDKEESHFNISSHNEAVSDHRKTEFSKTEDNPFSFKRFLQASNGNLINGHRPSSNRISNLDLAHDLPDFVQDHYNSSDTEIRTNKHSHDSDLPDFARDMTSGSFAVNNIANSSIGARPKTFIQNAQSVEQVESQESLNFTDFLSGDVVDNCVKSLPDFLSDSCVGSTHARDTVANERDSVSLLKVRNAFLIEKLEELNLAYQTERERARGLSSQLQELHKYEKEDIHTLEKMVHQAESNLTQTNKQLKSEKEINVNLQQQIISLNNKVETLKNSVCTKCGSSFVRGQMEMASHQIAVAAGEAERLLKQLLGGVENLKAVSNMLASCDTTSNDCSE